jgi:hypothetical protein
MTWTAQRRLPRDERTGSALKCTRVSRDATVQTHEVNTAAPVLRSSTGGFHANNHTAMHGAAGARLPTLTCANLVY